MSDSEERPQRQRTPDSEVFRAYMTGSWAPRQLKRPSRDPRAEAAASRRARLHEMFPDLLLLIPAGRPKQRSNDTDYPFRPHTAFTYFTGWGSEAVPESVLVCEEGDWTLYCREPAGRDSDEFYANAALGEFWTGPRPHLDDVSAFLGIRVERLADWVMPDAEKSASLAMIREADSFLTEAMDRSRGSAQEAGSDRDDALAQAVSEMRLVKGEVEIAEMRRAVAATAKGFDDIMSALPRALAEERGERVIEGVFFTRARMEGYDIGYGTIAASGPHACILHWVRNDGPVTDGDLLLVDAGVELDSLYTADITRTIPVSGKFSEIQAKVYQAVLDAADAAFRVVRPGITFRTIHDTAMSVIADRLSRWGLLPVSAEESLSPEGGQHRRYMIHGTSHHLGLDVHDCAQARRELYLDGILEPGMVFTIEPGLYFQPDDLTVPPEWRGIGVRIEDNIVVTETGAENLSAGIPRTIAEVETWWTRRVEASA